MVSVLLYFFIQFDSIVLSYIITSIKLCYVIIYLSISITLYHVIR